MDQKEYLRALGARIRELRRSKGLTQEELGRALGTNHTAVGRIESGKSNCKIFTLVKISEELDLPLELLFQTDTKLS